MKEKDYEPFISEARWLLDKQWEANNKLMRRASTLLGFIGVEFGILAKLSKSDYIEVPYYKVIFSFVLLLLMASFACLVLALRNKPFNYPSLDKLAWIAKHSKRAPSKDVYEFIQNVEDPKQNLDSSLSQENEDITKWFGRGSALALSAQVLLGLLIILSWFEN